MKNSLKLYCKLDQSIKDDDSLTYPEKCVIAYLEMYREALPMIEIQDRFGTKWEEMNKIGKSLESKGKIKLYRENSKIMFELINGN